MKQEVIRIDLEGVNCYLGKAGDSFILFDTGGHLTMDKQYTNRCDKLEKELENAGCKIGNLKLIVLTHGDNDHVANAVHFRDKYDAKIAMHSGDLDLVENPTIDKVMKSFQYKSIIYKIVFLIIKNTIRKVSVKTLKDFQKFKPDIFLNEGDNLSAYGFEAEILHIPGHTDGSIGILTSEGDLICGDIFTNMKKPDTAPNAYDFKALNASVERLKNMNIKVIYPGHGNPFEAKNLL